jgi:phosphonate transport system substrate-binding protein
LRRPDPQWSRSDCPARRAAQEPGLISIRAEIHPALEQQFAKALFGMSFDNPAHRPVLEAEGLRQWIAPQLEAYAELREASLQQGFLTRPLA